MGRAFKKGGFHSVQHFHDLGKIDMTGAEVHGLEMTGYFPGVIGRITETHAVYYHENWGFDASFETQVGRELSEFIGEFQETRDGFWVAKVDGEFSGSVTIDGRGANEEGARLRWFIVMPDHQGRGVGHALINQAIDFSRNAEYPRVYLWTFQGLDLARVLYERMGFRVCEEHNIRQWGQDIKEQMFELVF